MIIRVNRKEDADNMYMLLMDGVENYIKDIAENGLRGQDLEMLHEILHILEDVRRQIDDERNV